MKELGRLVSHSAKPVVVHITALAVVREDKVFLLPVDADPDDSTTWLPVADGARCRWPLPGPSCSFSI